jgi:putative NADH-flavin reductase
MRSCIVGASGKLGQYMVGHALDRGFGPLTGPKLLAA